MHLGESTPITTVQDKEIVLTSVDGQNFRMKIADLAEAVRQVMPVATSEMNGMMSSNIINLLSHMDIKVSETGGAGILAEGVGFCFGYDKENPTSYCLFSFVRMPGKPAAIRDKIAGTLTIGNQNEQGTSIINGATNYLSITLL